MEQYNKPMKNKIYLIIYESKEIENDNIEGFLENEKDFKKWLFKHNKQRKADGEMEEDESEFKLVEVFNLLND